MKTYEDMIAEIGKGPTEIYDIKSSGINCSFYDERPQAIRTAERVAAYYRTKGKEADVTVSGTHVTVNVRALWKG
jgi:hypothetical protein